MYTIFLCEYNLLHFGKVKPGVIKDGFSLFMQHSLPIDIVECTDGFENKVH